MPITPISPSKIPWFKQYLFISIALAFLIGGLTVFLAFRAKDMIFYPRVSAADMAYSAKYYKDQQVALKGYYLPLSIRQRPLCTPEGGTKQYPDLRAGYKTYPAVWGLSDGDVDVAVRVVDTEGNEITELPKYQVNDQVEIKGFVRTATTLDDCNKDLYYNTVYLEVTPETVGFKQK